jgi:predicted porin
MSVYGFYSYQTARMQQRGLQQNACAIGTTYSFWSNGVVNTGAAVAGATLLATTTVSAANFLNVCGTASATSPLYAESRAWNSTQNDRNDVLGLGVKYDFGKAKLDLNYTYTNGRTGIRYGYNAAALGLTAPQAALAGDGFTNLTYAQNVIDASLLVPISKAAAIRLLYRYETGKIRDWHYDGVAANPTPSTNQQVYLDSGPQDYKASLIGVLLKIDL